MIDSEISFKMVVKEIDSFIQKFHQLWSAGVSAHLDLDTHAGEAWVGLRVQLGPAPGHLHHNVRPQPFQKHASPSRQRRRARREAARRAKAEEPVVQAVTVEDAEKVSIVVDVVVENAAEEQTEEANDVADEFCSNAEYAENILSDENSVRFRLIVTENTFCSDIEVFKSKVRQQFISTEVDISNQHFEISGYEKKNNQSKFYLKIRNDNKAIEAIRNLKSEDILMRKIPQKKPNS